MAQIYHSLEKKDEVNISTLQRLKQVISHVIKLGLKSSVFIQWFNMHQVCIMSRLLLKQNLKYEFQYENMKFQFEMLL